MAGEPDKRMTGSSKRWLVLISGYMIVAMVNGILFAWGRVLIDIMDTFNATRAEASLIHSVIVGLVRGGGIIWGLVTSRLGARYTGLIAASVSTAGLIASYFARSIAHSVISVGVIFSAGAGTTFMCAMVAVGQHFSGKANAMALSVLSTAAGIGSIVYSYLLGYLSDTYGLRGMFLILAGFSLHGVAFAWLWSSPDGHKRQKDTDNSTVITHIGSSPRLDNKHFEHSPVTNKCIVTVVSNIIRNKEASNNSGNTTDILTETHEGVVTKTITIPKSVFTFQDEYRYSGKDIEEESTSQKNVLGRLKVVLMNRHFIIFNAGIIIASPCVQVLVVFLMDIIVNKGFSESEASLVFILFSIFSVIGRLTTGFIMKIPKITALSVPLIACMLAMTVLWSLDIVQWFPLIVVLCCASGAAVGMYMSIAVVCTLELVGVKCLPEGLGVVATSLGISAMFSGPVAGSLRDITGSYTVPLLVAAVATSVAFLVFLAGQCYKKPSAAIPEKRMSVFYVTQM